MNKQLEQAKQDSENKIVAMREKAQATLIAKYGEHAASFIGGMTSSSPCSTGRRHCSAL